MIAVVDYGAGNLYSVMNALRFLKLPAMVTAVEAELEQADRLILPGVGAFPAAMRQLEERNLVEVLKEQVKKKPLLGICLGMQLLFDEGFEFEPTRGLGLIPGTVEAISGQGLKVPHMGWSATTARQPSPLTEGLKDGAMYYFVHSYRAIADPEYIVLECQYGGSVPALVRRGHVYGAQFHPEKSGAAGLALLKRFGEAI